MRVLVAGYGSAGKRHAKNARELGHEVHVIDRDKVAQGRAHDDGFAPDVELPRTIVVKDGDLGASPDVQRPLTEFLLKADAIVIATPAEAHFRAAEWPLAEGYSGPLFVEKPLDVNLENAEFWRSWPSACTCVGYNWRFLESVRNHDRRHITEVSALTRTDMASWPGAGYASPLLEGSHDIDLLRMFIGRSARVTYSARDDRGAWNLELQSDKAKAAWRLWPNSPNVERALWVNGRRAYLFDGAKAVAAAVEPTYRAELGAFLEAAGRGTPVPGAATFEDGLAVLKIVEQAEEDCLRG